MSRFTGHEISPRRGAYLRFILEQGGVVKPTELSVHFKVDPSTVTRTVAFLSHEGFVDHVPYRAVTLTSKGRNYAAFLLRRHRILGLVLSQHGLSSEEACTQATRMEGFLPQPTVDKMCASLGHPTVGICGAIPPDARCCNAVEARNGKRSDIP